MIADAYNLDQAREYLARVVPWPEEGEKGYVNIHWFYAIPGREKPGVTGRPCKTVDQAAKVLKWVLSKDDVLGIYACMSLQEKSQERISRAGRPYLEAVRSQENALALKSLFLDIDVKEGAYANTNEAAGAFVSFCRATGMPGPSVLVKSGSGGLHCYWSLDHALTPGEWKPLAHALVNATKKFGLNCDSACTIDAARVLRIPNTWNRKNGKAQPVEFGCRRGHDYSVEYIDQILAPYKTIVVKPGIVNPELDPNIFPPKQPLPRTELSEGIEKQFPPVNIDAAANECAFIKTALDTGGKDYANPLWNLTTLIATFCEDGRAQAHRMGNQHAGYTQQSTDELFDRKEREKEEKGLGWPRCQTISNSGCKACQSCPHFTEGKSPLHFTLPAEPERTGSVVAAENGSFADPWADFVGPQFPVGMLPPTLANFVDAEHRAMGADPSALAMAAVTAVAGALHAETLVQLGNGWWERPNLWTALIGSPSTKRSPIIDKAIRSLRRIDHQQDQVWRQQEAFWQRQSKAGGNPGPRPAKPARSVIQDATPEKTAEILSRDSRGSLIIHDELAGWIDGFDRYGSGPSARAFYLTCWNGGPFLRDRVGQGARDSQAEIRIENLAASVLGGIQPDRLAAMGDLTGDGLLQRFLPVLMRPTERGDEDHPVIGAETKYDNLIRAIHSATPRSYQLAPDATEVRKRVLDRLYELEQLDGFPSSLIGAIGKLKGYYGRIALVLHVAAEHDDLIRGQGSNIGAPISRQVAEAAECVLMDFVLPHILGLYDVIANGGKDRETVRAIAGFILAFEKDRLRPSDFTMGVRKLKGQPQQKIVEWAGRFCAMGWLTPENEAAAVPKAWIIVRGLREHFAERRKHVKAARAAAHEILRSGGTRRRP